MIGIIGRKLGMTTIFDEVGVAIAVTVIEAGPCTIMQIRDNKKDGYSAIQLGYGSVKDKHLKKPQLGQFKKADLEPKKYLKEFRLDDTGSFKVGQEVKADIFQIGDFVDAKSLSKGRGFAGVMKRHNYQGGPMTHGSNFRRRAGSIGCNSYPARVWKGKGMPGHMGNAVTTIQNLKVVEIRPEDNLIMVKGSIPGSINSIVKLTVSVKKRK